MKVVKNLFESQIKDSKSGYTVKITKEPSNKSKNNKSSEKTQKK